MRKSVHCNVIRKPAQHVAAPTDYLALDVKLRAALDEFSILERLAKNIKDAVKASRDEYGDHQLERGDMVTISGSSPDTSLGFQIEMSADGSQIDVAVFDISAQKSDISAQKETAGPLDDYDIEELEDTPW